MTRSADRGLHRKGTLLMRVLFTSFAHLEANVSIHLPIRRSNGKGTLLIRVLFSTGGRFEANVATRSADRRSHDKGT